MKHAVIRRLVDFVHFLKTYDARSFPGSAGLQPGSRSHAGAWRFQGVHKHSNGNALGMLKSMMTGGMISSVQWSPMSGQFSGPDAAIVGATVTVSP
jgi:hypothetical protein